VVVSTPAKKGKNRGAHRDIIRKQLRLKGHRVTSVENNEDSLIIFIRPNGERLLRCGVAEAMLTRSQCEEGAGMADLSMRRVD